MGCIVIWPAYAGKNCRFDQMSISSSAIEPSAAIPSIRPRWWPSLLGSLVLICLIPFGTLIPYEATWSGTVTNLNDGSCTVTPDSNTSTPATTLTVSGNTAQRSNDQVVFSPCADTHLKIDTTVGVVERTNLLQTIQSFTDDAGVSE